MKRQVQIVSAFDAFAGSQRMAAMLHQTLQASGVEVRSILGFGRRGFISQIPAVRAFMRLDNIRLRKLLYPLWLCWINFTLMWSVSRGHVVWANTIYAAPAILLASLLRPRRLVLHVHEIECPRVMVDVARFLKRRGATLVCVSQFQRQQMALDAVVLPNCVRTLDCQHTRRDRFIFVGTATPAKGLPLFIAVAQRLRSTGIACWAFLPSRPSVDPRTLAEAEAAGIQVRFGVTEPSEFFHNGFLSMMASNPALVTETFSLVCAESIACLVPVVGAGTLVIKEVAGPCLAFDDPTRDPAQIADFIKTLWADQERRGQLTRACAVRREQFSPQLFGQRADALINCLDNGATLA